MNIEERGMLVWLKDGSSRRNILNILQKDRLLSSEIANRLNKHRSSISRTLKNLKQKGLIEFIEAGSRTREYSTTEKGKKYLKLLEN